MANKKFGEILRNLRNKNGFTQQQVADLLQLKNKSTLGSWEIGKSEPDGYTLLKLCKIYNVKDIYEAFNEIFNYDYLNLEKNKDKYNKSKKKSLKELIEEEDKKQFATITGYNIGVKTIELGEKEFYTIIKNDNDGYEKIDTTKDEFVKIKDMLHIIRK